MASGFVAPRVVKAQTLSCPNCGAGVERRGFGYTQSVVCPQCLSVLDASTPVLQLLQRVEAAQNRRTPLIPLGSRGAIAGAQWDAIGFQTRSIVEDGIAYEWEEYLLFNPYQGFRYLTQYDGHWNFVTPLEAMPQSRNPRALPPVIYDGHWYKHFSGGDASTTFVLGEFPWRVTVGEQVETHDYVDPPFVLSSEITPDETTWSRGEYKTGAEIWKAFNLPGRPPYARGVYLNQPSPLGDGRVGGMWTAAVVMMTILVVLAAAFTALSQHQVVLQEARSFSTADKGEPSYVTDPFDLTGRTATVELTLNTNLSQDWAYFNFALINQDTGEADDFGQEVSYYSGSDSDGSWTEGSPNSTFLIPSVKPGKYYLRVEPEMDTESGLVHAVHYDLTLRHDVPSYAWFWIAAVLLLLPPIAYTMRARSFETQRWMNSDHPPVRRGISSYTGGDD